MTAPPLASAAAIYRTARRVYLPSQRLGPVEWIEKHVNIPEGYSFAAGPYRFALTPWWREVAEVLCDDLHDDVVIMKSAQVGATQLLNAIVAYWIAGDPSSIMLMQSSIEAAEDWSKTKLEPLFGAIPAVQEAMRGKTVGMARSSDDTIRLKRFRGGFLKMVGANSAPSLRSHPIRRLLADDVDAFPEDAGGEGAPLELGELRTRTYWNKKRGKVSTPTDEGASVITEEYAKTDQRRWMVRCPHCDEEQPLEWRDEEGNYHLVFDRDDAGNIVDESVMYRCAHCAALIDERHKTAMVAAGRWVPTNPSARARGYHISSLYASWVSWATIVREFDKAKVAENTLKTFINGTVGLPFAPTAEKTDPKGLMARSESWEGVPPGVGAITAGIDLQGDRAEIVLSGWGDDERCWVLDWRQVYGDLNDREWFHAEVLVPLEAEFGPLLVGVAADTGYRQEVVWSAATRPRKARLFPVKGIGTRGAKLVTPPGATSKKGQRRPWLVGSQAATDELHARLRAEMEGPKGIRFHETLPAEFYDQLTAERKKPHYINGRPVSLWYLPDGLRCDVADGWKYSLAALHALGPRMLLSLKERAEKRRAAPVAPAEPPPRDPMAPIRAVPRRSGGWVTGWKR